ncbi:MAG: glycosyltransferase [Bacteroides sp.]|nr:glycosyltransferase [Bacteroides sp.]
MSKPSIIILMHYLELGGAEMALIGLLSALDPEKVDVDLFIYDHRGPLMKYIPGHVNLLPEKPDYSVIERSIGEAVSKRQFGVVAGRLLAKLKHRNYRRNASVTGDDSSAFHYVGECVTPFLSRINPDKEYDLCISFLTPHHIGLKKVRARKRLAWIHTDYSTIHINAEAELPVWNGYDHIASISPEVTKAFVSVFPSLENKILPIENILPAEYIRRRAEERDVLEEMPAKLKFLSIGRFTYQKNFDNVPFIASELLKAGIDDFQWYLIGYGGDEELIRQKIAKAGMEDKVIILGKKENPYPYIKACDIYIQPSRYEGKSVTVREAQILSKPVIITDYPTAKSQVNDGVDGIIVPLDNKGCVDGIRRLLEDNRFRHQIIEHLFSHDFANEQEIDKIYNLLG